MESYCRKCLLKDISKEEYFKNVYEYTKSLDEEIKTPDGEYERRLGICKECDKLINGMCAVCGCFVEVRAAKKINYCPDVNRKW